MPDVITYMGDYCYLSVSKNVSSYEVSYKSENGEISQLDQRLEDALARMRLWMSKVGIIK